MRIDGNELASQWKKKLKAKIEKRKIKPRLLIVLMARDENSMRYAKMKKKVGEELGVEVKIDCTYRVCAEWGDFDGVVVQRPKKVDKKLWKELVNQIPLDKDVDGLRSDSKWEAPVVKVVRKILRDFQVMQNIVIIGKGPTVGGPIIRFLKKTSGVYWKVCDSKMSKEELEKVVGEADLVITGTGIAGLVKAKWLKSGAGVIDFGWGRPEVEGDLEEKTSFYTPVPGGVGPMIIMALMENVIKSCLWQKK